MQSKLKIYYGGPGWPEHRSWLLLSIKATPGCHFIAIVAELPNAPANNPATGER
eukprot:gene31056-7150_t